MTRAEKSLQARIRNRSPKEAAWMRMTIEESIIASLKRRIKPDDLEDKDWLRFKNQMRDGDELWYFKSPIETWTEYFPLCGLEGYALVRNNKVVDEILLAIS